MISVQEAQDLVFQYTKVRPIHSVSITELQNDLLREPLFADRSYPPFDRVAMDGIALCTKSWHQGQRAFSIQGCQRAGTERLTLGDSKACIEVMTGAPLPRGTDCVIRYEDIHIESGVATFCSEIAVQAMQNVHRYGSDYAKGEPLLSAEAPLLAPQASIAASIGQSSLSAAQKPKIAIVSTGDELVDIDATPEYFQIRRSNSYALLTSLRDHGFHHVTLEHLQDNKKDIYRGLQKTIEENDVVILSGGVSMGKFDFIPSCLNDLGVQKVFHKVRQRPGKPLWFGLTEDQKTIFGLPGNPVSALVCLHRYVLPSLWNSLGLSRDSSLQKAYAILSEDVSFKKSLTYFLAVQVAFSQDGTLQAHPVSSNGSGDFSSLAQSAGFMELPENQEVFHQGQAFPLFFWRRRP